MLLSAQTFNSMNLVIDFVMMDHQYYIIPSIKFESYRRKPYWKISWVKSAFQIKVEIDTESLRFLLYYNPAQEEIKSSFTWDFLSAFYFNKRESILPVDTRCQLNIDMKTGS